MGYLNNDGLQHLWSKIASELDGLNVKIEAINIPDVSAYQTEEQVLALINAQLGVIENGSY